MGTKMKNAPVYYALAAVRFNTLALLDQYVPALQDNLRKAGYPDFSQSVIAQFTLGLPGAPNNVMPTLQPLVRYQFLNEQRTSGFLLDQSSFSFQTADYDTSDPFTSNFMQGLRILNSTVQLSYSERLGLRFLDAVCPGENETLGDYLQPSMLGLFGHVDDDRELIHSISETRMRRSKITLVGRATILNQPAPGVAAFPAELQPVVLDLMERFKKVTGIYAVLDTDSWIEGREKFDVDNLGKTLALLQNEVRFSFDRMVTPHALRIWN